MSLPPLPERFTLYLAMLSQAVAKHTGWDHRMPPLLISGIIERLRRIKWTILRLSARIAAGKYARRPYAPRPGAKGRQPKNPLPREKDWLVPLMPEIVLYRGHLERLLHDPEMVALIQAAPEAMRPPLRSLCRLLGWPPPPILAKVRPPARLPAQASPPASVPAPARPSPTPPPGTGPAPPIAPRTASPPPAAPAHLQRKPA